MVFSGDAILAGKETRQGKSGLYCIVRLLAEDGKVFELLTRSSAVMSDAMKCNNLEKVYFEINVEQGKYPKYELMSITQ
jgi:hypothetical protein